MNALALPTLLLVVFVDLVGFGLVTPLIPFYGERLGLAPQWITLIVATYSLAQFVAAPLWGRLSDRVGRRPVLFACMVGHVGSYLILACADTVWLFLAARIAGGLTAGNLPVAYAYIADTVAPDRRAAAMGKVSGAFGLGFVLGPALGGLLAGGETMIEADLVRPALAAAAASALSAAMIAVFLPESRRARQAAPAGKSPLPPFSFSLRQPPVVAVLLVVCFVVIFSMSMRESIFSLWASHVLELGARTIGLLFAVSGGVVALVQFTSIGALTRRWGSWRLALAATALFAGAWLVFALVPRLPPVVLALAATAGGTALFQTSMQNLLADVAAAHERGRVMGAYQASSALGRYVGQSCSGTFYGVVHPSAPFLLGAALMLPAALLLWWIGRHLPVRTLTRTSLAMPAERTEP